MGFPVRPFDPRISLLASSVLTLLLCAPSHTYFWFYATRGDFCADAAAPPEQYRQQRTLLLKIKPLALRQQEPTRLLEGMEYVLGTASMNTLRRAAGKEVAVGRTVSRTLPSQAATIQGTTSGSAEATIPTTSSGPPAVATAAEWRAESSERPEGSEARRSLGGPPQAPTAAGSEVRTLVAESVEAGGTTALQATDPRTGNATAGETETSSEGNRVENAGRSVQQLQESRVLARKRSTGKLTRPVATETDGCIEPETANPETVPEGVQAFQSVLDELLGDVAEYAQLRRQRDFNEIAEKYADEEEIPEDEFSILSRARLDLTKLRDRKAMWIKVMLSSVFLLACAVLWLFPLLRPTAPLSYEATRQRDSEFRTASALLLGTLLVALFGNWRRRALNRKIYLQEIETDRIFFEALAGVRPTTKNVLGPSRKEIEKHRQALEKKAKMLEKQKQEDT